MKNILTIDVEEHFQVEVFTNYIARDSWEKRQSRATMNVMHILDLLDHHHATATFFVLGWVADHHPHLVAMIKARGHELASHGYNHQSLKRMTAAEFREDLQRATAAIKQAAGVTVTGYRAPTFSAERRQEWIWETLLECGFEYDSSIYPIRHDLYGDPSAPRFPYYISSPAGTLFEIPPTTYKFMGKLLPAAGGGSFRHFPYWYTRKAINAYNNVGHAALVYLHPWEIDTAQPREKVDFKTRLRHYCNLSTVEPKLKRLLGEFEFGSVRDVYPDLGGLKQRLQNKGKVNGKV